MGRSPPARDSSEPLPSDPDWSGRTVLIDKREAISTASPEAVFSVIESIGGEKGYFSLSRRGVCADSPTSS